MQLLSLQNETASSLLIKEKMLRLGEQEHRSTRCRGHDTGISHFEISFLKGLNSIFKASLQIFGTAQPPLMAIKYSAIINEQNAAA